MTETILEEARRVVDGERQSDYGHPLDNHGCTADLWRVWLARKYGVVLPISPEDVCVLNILQKLSREANHPKRDTLVDVCGYARNIEMVQTEREDRLSATGGAGQS